MEWARTVTPEIFRPNAAYIGLRGNTRKVRFLRCARLALVACGSSWPADVYSTTASVVWASCLRAFNPTSLYCRRPTNS